MNFCNPFIVIVFYYANNVKRLLLKREELWFIFILYRYKVFVLSVDPTKKDM